VEVPEEVVVQVQAQKGGQAREGGGGDLCQLVVAQLHYLENGGKAKKSLSLDE